MFSFTLWQTNRRTWRTTLNQNVALVFNGASWKAITHTVLDFSWITPTSCLTSGRMKGWEEGKRQPGNSPQRLSLKPPLLHLTLCPGSPDKPTNTQHPALTHTLRQVHGQSDWQCTTYKLNMLSLASGYSAVWEIVISLCVWWEFEEEHQRKGTDGWLISKLEMRMINISEHSWLPGD